MRPRRLMGQVRTRPRAQEPAPTGVYLYDATMGRTELLWKCLKCGEIMPRNAMVPDSCPSCHAPKTEFVWVDED